MPALRFAAAAALLMVMAACSDSGHNDTTNESHDIPRVLSVQPPDNAASVPCGANIRVIFNVPMDTASVDRSFYLATGPGLLQWMDSVNVHGDDGRTKMDSLIAALNGTHYRGSLMWNSRLDSMVFVPDTLLLPNQPHLILLLSELKSRSGRSMVMDSLRSGRFVTRFVTIGQDAP